MLMIGPPGAGKSMLAARLPGLLPPLDAREALEISMVQSLAGELRDGAISRRRPFRNPHHSASMAALTGGGLRVKPGEVSLAHLGVLFLDELPEFQRGVLDSLAPADGNRRGGGGARQRACALSRAFPAGGRDESVPLRLFRRAGAGLRPRAQMRQRLSGAAFRSAARPHRYPCGGASVSAQDLALPPPAEGTAAVAERVAKARSIQRERFDGQASAPMRRRKARCWIRWQRPMPPASGCSPMPPMRCGSRRAAIIACCASRAPLPISRREHVGAARAYRRGPQLPSPLTPAVIDLGGCRRARRASPGQLTCARATTQSPDLRPHRSMNSMNTVASE